MKKNSFIKIVGCLVIVAILTGLNLLSVFATEDTWVTKASMPTARDLLCTAVVNGNIYAIGGWDSSSGYKNTVEKYDPVTNTWTTKASSTLARYCMGAEVVDGEIYVVGGDNYNVVFDTVEVYNPTTNVWGTKASMPTPRTSLGVAAVNGKIYAIGGHNKSSDYLSVVEEYNPATNTWVAKANMPTPRYNLGVAVVNDKIYAIGGQSNSGHSSVVEEYDPVTNVWSTRQNMSVAKHSFGTATANGKVYTIGGHTGSFYTDSVEEYVPATNTWTARTSMPSARMALSASVVNNKIYAIGGWAGGVFLNTVQEYTPPFIPTPTPSPTPTPTPTATPTPSPTPTPTGTTTPIVIPGILAPNMSTDMTKYIQGETVQLALKFTNTQSSDKTNSVTFQIDYDGDTFEPLTGNLDSDISNSYLPSNIKLDLGSGSNKCLHISYINMNTDISLQEGVKVFIAKFKVKKTATPGKKTFTLKPVTMLDSSNNAYKIKDADPITVDIMGEAAIEGYMSIYLGDSGTDLNTSVLDKLNRTRINDTLKNLKFTLKLNQSDTGIVLNGSDIFIPDENGNLAVKSSDDKVRGRFRVFTSDPANAILTLNGAGYLKKNITLPALNLSKLSAINDPYSAAEIYPGDIGQVADYTLVLNPDDKITNADFSAWLKTYKDNLGSIATIENVVNADFTKDSEIDNVDFSLWLATFKKILTGVQ